MNVHIMSEREKFVAAKLASGKFKSPEEIVDHALQRLEEEEQELDARLLKMKAAVQVGIEQANRGEVTPLDIDQLIAEETERYHRNKA